MNLSEKLTEKLAESKRFIQFVVRHFIEDDCTYHASALAFSSILAIVPLMSIGLAILSIFPVFESLATTIQNFVFVNFVPTTGQIIQNYMQIFATQVTKLSFFGVVFLFVLAILVLYTIEQSMNKIWRVNVSRRGILAFLLYWAIVSLAPFLLVISLAVSSYIISIPMMRSYDVPALLNYTPLFFSLAGFTFLFVAVPNCKVRFLHGFYGAIVATLLFESAKYAFALYLKNYNIYELVYGAFATIPIFIIWIYWAWLITLLGAEVSYAFSVHYQRRPGTPLDGFTHALLWLYQLRLAQLEGKSLTVDDLIDASTHAYEVDIGEMLKQLSNLQLIKATNYGDYILSRNLSHLTLYDLTQLLPYRLPKLAAYPKESICKKCHGLIQKADTQLKQTLMISLEDLFQGSEPL